VDAALAFRRGHALDAMDAGFVFQAGKHVAAGDLRHALLDAAQAGVGVFQDLDPPALRLRVFLIHLEQLGGEQPGLVAAGSGADFQDGAAGVGLVLGQQGQADLVPQGGQAVLQLIEFGLGQVLHLGVREHRLRIGLGTLGRAQLANALDDRGQLGQLLAGAGERVAAHPLAKLRRQLRGAADDAVKLVVQAAAHASRPARSARATSACAPVARSFTCATPRASSASPMMTAARAPMRLARSIRRFMLPL